jgi:hypothetical protein
MKKYFYIFLIILNTSTSMLLSQEVKIPEVYLITCNPGVETYSHYGHSALRIKIPDTNSDFIYNWGVFDFSSPNFAWKFAKGRLEYMLVEETFKQFITGYISEKRSVYQQKANLEPNEINTLISLIAENLKPENVKYRYDFFYDDCSTRIRDLFEKSVGNKLLYPPVESKILPTFRDKVGEYNIHYPWLKLGIDLIMGISADKKVSLRDQMFLPFDLQKGLSQTIVRRGDKMIPLLQNPVSVFESDPVQYNQSVLNSPLIVTGFFLVLLIILTAMNQRSGINKAVDIILFALFSGLAMLMVFFNFFTDHLQMKWNLNIIWLNPFLILCLISVITERNWKIWFKISFYLAVLYLLPLIFLPHIYNNGLIPLALIIILRTSVRAGFSWNPFSTKRSLD